jgi:hypothetical protein
VLIERPPSHEPEPEPPADALEPLDWRDIARALRRALAWVGGALQAERRRSFDLLIAAATGALVVARLALVPGIPAFQQDWTWPTSADTLRGWFELATLPWNWNGLGNPQIYPFADYAVSLAAVAAMVLGSKVVLTLLVAGTSAAGGFAAAGLMRCIGIRSRLALALGIVTYGASPVLFNKLAAGHTYYLLGYALLPALCVRLTRMRSAGIPFSTAALALELAASFTQAQYLVFDGIVVAAWALVRNRALARSELIAMSAAFALALAIHAYPLVSLVTPQAGFALVHQHATLEGVATESVGVHDLLLQDGYPPGYFRRVWEANRTLEDAGLALGSFALLGLCTASALAFARREPRRFAREPLALTGIVLAAGIVLVLGLKGPAAPLLGYAFTHVAGASILKELYHAMVLVSLGVAVGAAAGMDVLCSAVPTLRGGAVRTGAALAVVALACALAWPATPMLFGEWLGFVGREDGTAFDRVVAGVPRGPSPTRFIALPMAPPIRSDDRTEGGGNDSDATRPWAESSLYMGAPDPALAYLETAMIVGPEVRLDYLFRRFGVAFAVDRIHFVSAAPEQQDLPPAVRSGFLASQRERRLEESGVGLIGAGSDVRVLRGAARASALVLAGSAPLRGGDDVALADADIASGAWPEHYTPVIESSDLRLDPSLVAETAGAVGTARDAADWTIPLDRFVDLSQAALGFDAERGWTSIQNSFLRNRWQNFSPTGGLYTESPAALALDVANASGRYPAVLAATSVPGNPAFASGAVRGILMPLVPNAARYRQHFTWFVSRVPLAESARLTIAFPHQRDGVAVAAVALVRATDLRPLVATSGPPRRGDAASGSVTIASATPTALAGTFLDRGAACSLTLLTNFDRRWHATIGGVPQPRHFRADGWANGWIVPCGAHPFALTYDGRFFTIAFLAGWLLIGTLGAIALATARRSTRSPARRC